MFRGRSTLFLALIALGLVCYLTFIDKKLPGTAEQAQSETQLFKFDQEDVTGMEINNVHGAFVFQKKNDHWEITSPVNTLADTATIQEIIGQIAFAEPQRTIHLDGSDQANQSNLKEWGLAPAAERVILHLKDRSLELLVGRKVAISDSVYARTSGHHSATVRLIPSAVKTILQKDLSDFRSRNIFDFQSDRVLRVATRVTNTATTPEEYEADLKDGKWMLQKPLIARASTSDVEAMLAKVLALRITDFVTDAPSNLAQYGLTSPAAMLSVTVAPDDEGVLLIGSPVPGKTDQVYAQRVKSNSVFTLTQSSVTDVLKALPNVRDRHILPFDAGKVTAVSFTYDNKKASLQKDKGVWRTIGEMTGTADVGKVTDLLTKLSDLETTPVLKDSAPDLKPYGLDKPAGKISITSPEFKTPLTLSIGKDDNHLLYVRNSTEPFIYTVADTAFDALGSNLTYRDFRVVNLILSKVRSMTITPQGEPALVLTRSPGGTWSAANAKNRMIDNTKAETQASLLCQLQAKTWLGAPLPTYGLDKPVLKLALLADTTSVVLKIGAPLPDGSHAAQLDGSPNAFELSDADYGMLNASSLQLLPEGMNTNTGSATNAPAASTNSTVTPAQPTPKKHKKKKTE